MRRSPLLVALLLFGVVGFGFAKHVSLHGFVTAVHSPVSFEMDQYKIVDETEQEHQRLGIVGKRDYRSPQLKPGVLRVGLEVEVKGDYDRTTGRVTATGIKALNNDSDPDKSVEGMGLVEEKTSLERTASGWSGRFTADGETLVLGPDTTVSVKRSRSERKDRQNLGLETDDASFSPDDIDINTFAYYVGVRQSDHSILVTKVEFQQDRAGTEQDLSYLETRVIYQNPKSEAGTLSVGKKEYELFPSPEAADYLGKLGASLIPTRQRELPDRSPGKVRFRFFLTNTDYFGVDTYPNGVVVVSAKVFDVLDNEAQLAFVLSHEIARVVEKQNWTASIYHEKERKEVEAAGLATVLVVPGSPLVSSFVDKSIARRFVRSLQSQADRVGMECMIAAGYDPNQAVESWRTLEKKRAHGPFWGDPDENFVRRTYLESEIRLDYGDRDFSSLKRDSADFHGAVGAIKAARLRAKTKKK